MSAQNDLSQIKEIINEIEGKSADGVYIFRGERRSSHTKVSSTLYRDFDGIDDFNIETIQKEMLNAAKKHTGHLPHTDELPPDFRPHLASFFGVSEEDTAEVIDFEMLTEIQHYGGKTNLIDFTTDYLIALFFACDGHHDKDGRIILQKVETVKDIVRQPRNPRNRVVAQKSVFIRSPKGFIQPCKDDIVIIPAHLKNLILQYLRKYHGIFTETIYNDLHGFIRNQDIHGSADTQVYRGLAHQNKGDGMKDQAEKRRDEVSIEHYTKAIELKPDMTAAYFNRGVVYIKNGEYDRAIADLTELIELKPDDAEVYLCRGWAYDLKGNFDCAIEDYNRAIQIKRDYANAYLNRGAVYGKKNEIDFAIKDFNRAIELKHDYVEAYNNRGSAYYEIGKYDRAIGDFTKVIELKPHDITAHNNRALAYEKKDDFDSAIADYTKVIDVLPSEIRATL